MPLNPDATLLNGQYRILRQLGRGGFGFVYQAQDTLLRDEVAIKELIPALVGDETTLKRFLAEARATMRLANDHLVRTHNVFQEGGNYYIVMECMSGGSLEDRLRVEGALPVGEAVRIAAEVCAGLDYAHRRGIVHCDLKPANILFAADGTAKVADFGIAHVSEQVLTRSWMTPAGFVAGTLPYMSPEQADGVREDPRVDVYALGAVLYRMLTGRTYLDFDQRETPGAQADNVYRIRNAQPDPPSAHNRRIPAWLDKVVLQALSKHPDERYGSAAKMGAVLVRRGAALPVPPQAAAPGLLTPARPRPVGRPAWFWPVSGAAGVLIIAIVVALGLLFSGGPGPAETPAPEPTQIAEVEPTPTLTLQPTHTPPPPMSTSTPTGTPRPTATAYPTASQTPSSTPEEILSPSASPSQTPSSTPTSRATSTSVPLAQPSPVSSNGPIAFVSDRDGNHEIYIMNADGSGQRNLTNSPADDRNPCWSPGGDRIAFASNREGSWSLYVMAANGNGTARILEMGGEPRGCSWASDGNRVAYSYGQIHIIRLDGGGDNALVAGLGMSWSPGGSSLAFEFWNQQLIRSEVWTVSPDGSGRSYVGEGRAPAWSPDGARIAFVYNIPGGSTEIYTMDTGGAGWVNLTNNRATDGGSGTVSFCGDGSCLDGALLGGPSWSRDGRRIVFSSNRDGNFEIYRISASGEDITRLTNNAALDAQPAWAP